MAKDTELGEILMGAFVARRLLMIQLGEGNVVLFGSKGSARTLAIREFLTRNGHPFTYVDIDMDSCAGELMEKLAVRSGEIPVVYCNRRYVLRNPSIAELAACLDLNINVAKGVRDVLVIGAGPAGLAAAVYAASEGLKTLVIEKSAPGGQAGSSSKIENYLGFPTGLSGQELANRSIAQAQKFGAQLMVAQSVVHIDSSRRPYKVILESGLKFNSHSVVIATGAQYARLPIEVAEAFTGRRIYYNATHMEAQLCDSEEVAVVGGGKLCGTSGRFPCSDILEGASPGTFGKTLGIDVAVSDCQDRSASQNRRPLSDSDCCCHRHRASGKYRVEGRLIRTHNNQAGSPRVCDGGCRASHGVA
jgi:thioredoxin reductase (NADPH)